MTVPVTEVVITLLLAASFAALGESVLGKRSETFLSWNESFLVGAGTSAALLFPLSAVFGNRALHAALGLLMIALFLTVVRRLRGSVSTKGSAGPGPGPVRANRDPVAIALLLAIAFICLLFTVLNFRYAYLWDGFQIWASKAQLLYDHGRLGPEWYPGSDAKPIAPNYPALVPFYEALLCVLRRGFDFDVLKPVFVVFYVSMLLSTFGAARARLSERLALAATLLLALLPMVSTSLSAGGYADMPQGAFVAGVAAGGLAARKEGPGWRQPLPWLIGSLTTVKSEGTLLAEIACLAIALLWWGREPRQFLERCKREAGALAVIAAFFGLRFGYLRWVSIPDLVYGPVDAPHLARALSLLRVDAVLCSQELFDLRNWALLWPAFFVAALLLFWRGEPSERCLALGTAAGVAAYSAIFLFSNMPPEIHIPNAYSRLLAQLAPAASLTVLLGYERARLLALTATRSG
jgi:hypothetical protein